MTDVLNAKLRKFNMSLILSRDTKPEMLVRRGLHAEGLRYRLHDRTRPGRTDLFSHNIVQQFFVHGCFWHCHKCAL